MKPRRAPPVHRAPRDIYTPRGELVRLVMRDGEPVGAVVIATPNPWVYRTPWLTLDDVA